MYSIAFLLFVELNAQQTMHMYINHELKIYKLTVHY